MGLPQTQPEIDVCAECGKLFPRVHVALCSEHERDGEARFRLVREHVRDHGAASLGAVAHATGLPVIEIKEMIASGRLVEMTKDELRCTCAFEPAGRRCVHCRMTLAPAFREHVENGGAATTPGPLPGTESRSRKLGDDDDHGRVQYVRRVRRERDTGR